MYEKFKGRHILSMHDLDREDLEFIIAKAKVAAAKLKEHEHSLKDLLKWRRMCFIFYAPSTRTALSFKGAADLTGMTFDGIMDPKTSSAAKGEILIDTTRNLNGYFNDVFVIRHDNEGAVRRASEYAVYPKSHRLAGQPIPVINCGDGANQHPTQTMTDFTAIDMRFGTIDGLVYLFNNDLKYSRTVHSDAEALLLFRPRKVYFCCSAELGPPDSLLEQYERSGIDYEVIDRYEDVLPEVDVFYDTRPQLNLGFISDPTKEKIRSVFKVRAPVIRKHSKAEAAIMHPLPRDFKFMSPELEVDNLPQAYYFEEAHIGLPTRVALLALVQGVRL
ncbi:aspartate carbamoyltransferase [Candidatus Woesearchaeota archaeon]|nr:aspartate carbamoyltransferase [Candidatus Woesearchaeota archaeon]